MDTKGTTMAKKQPSQKQSLTDLLRQALNEADSIRAVARDTGLHHASLLRFHRGERTLMLDNAEKLMAYFDIEARRKGGD